MKVFISWSGTRSKEVAELLSDWLRCVIQAVRPWVSSRDVDRGTLWFGEINDQLKDTAVGVICLTQENKSRPWILFEAGALAKGLSTSRVCTILIDLEPKDIGDPLAQFNHTWPNRESMSALVKTLNGTLGQAALDNRVLEQVFDTYWPQFERSFQAILAKTKTGPVEKPREKEDILAEILDNTRVLAHRIRRVEAQQNANLAAAAEDRERREMAIAEARRAAERELALQLERSTAARRADDAAIEQMIQWERAAALQREEASVAESKRKEQRPS